MVFMSSLKIPWMYCGVYGWTYVCCVLKSLEYHDAVET